MSKSEMTIGNGLAVICFLALLIAAALQEKPEVNFVAASGCLGADCAWCDTTFECQKDDSCICFPLPEVPTPKPEPITSPPSDDVGPIDDDGSKVMPPTCYCEAKGKRCKCDNCECGLEPLKDKPREIILHSRDNCPPCDSWWANERPKFESAGWVVALHVLSNSENGRTPFFTVDVAGRQFELQGYQTLKQVEERLK